MTKCEAALARRIPVAGVAVRWDKSTIINALILNSGVSRALIRPFKSFLFVRTVVENLTSSTLVHAKNKPPATFPVRSAAGVTIRMNTRSIPDRWGRLGRGTVHGGAKAHDTANPPDILTRNPLARILMHLIKHEYRDGSPICYNPHRSCGRSITTALITSFVVRREARQEEHYGDRHKDV